MKKKYRDYAEKYGDVMTFTFRGDRNEWVDFVTKVKKERKQVWEVLKPLIDSYMRKEFEEKK